MQDLASTFAGYRLHDRIGRDAVTTTFRATREGHDRARGRTVALQVSAPLSTGIDRRRAILFQRKATAAMDIEHPGIARVVDVGIADDRVYAATAWRPSITLDQMMGRHWRLDPAEAVAMLRPLAEGLDAVHAAGIVHGALGIRTIRVASGATDEPPAAFATGFGCDALLALRIGSKRDRDAGAVLDDLLYVAPEQLREGRVEPATDQYALACALYHCLTGEPPFVRDTASALFGAHMFARPPAHELPTSGPGAAARWAIGTGLAKAPDERHPSCTALLRTTQVEMNGDRHQTPTPAASEVPPAAWSAVAAAASTAPVPTGAPQPVGTRATSLVASAGRSAASALRSVPPLAIAVGAALLGVLAVLLLADVLRNDPTVPASADRTAQRQPAEQADQDAGGAAAVDAAPPEPDVVAWEQPVADGKVAQVTMHGDALVVTSDTAVAALDPASGRVRWRRPVPEGDVGSSTTTDAMLVYRTPTELHAVSLDDGQPQWSRDDQYTPTGFLTAAPGGPLYGMGPGRIVSELMAMDPTTGVEEWHFHGEQVTVLRNASIAADRDMVVILQDGTMFGLDPDAELFPSGAGRRQIEDERFRVIVTRPWRASLTLRDDAVLLARRNGAVCSHARSDAEQQWCRRVTGVRDARPQLLVDGDQVVVVAASAVTALDRTSGAQRWTAPTGGHVSAATVVGSAVLVAERGGRVRALDAGSGDVRWELTGETTMTTLAAVGDAVYAGTRDGSVVRLRPDTWR